MQKKKKASQSFSRVETQVQSFVLVKIIISHQISNYSIFLSTSRMFFTQIGGGESSSMIGGDNASQGRFCSGGGGEGLGGVVGGKGSGWLLSLSKALWVGGPVCFATPDLQPLEGSPNHITSERRQDS